MKNMELIQAWKVLDLIDSMLDPQIQSDNPSGEVVGWNRGLIALGRKIDPKFHKVKF